MGIALIIIDIQNDYFEGGRNPLHHAEKAAKNAGNALALFRDKQLPVFHIQHISLQEGATFFLPETEGKDIHHSVKPVSGENVLIKHKPNSFFKTGLHEKLDNMGIKKLVVCGMMTHMCIDTTVRCAKDHFYEVLLLNDACTTRDLVWEGKKITAEDVHKTFMSALQGTFAKIINTNELESHVS